MKAQPISFEPRQVMDRLFSQWSARDTLRRILRGLRSRPGTGDYNFARRELPRAWSYVSALVLPVLVILLLTVLSRTTVNTPIHGPTVLVHPDKPPKPLEPLPKPKPIDPPPSNTPDPSIDLPGPDLPPIDDPLPGPTDSTLTERPHPFVHPIKSPVKLVGFYTSRTPGVIDGTLAGENASGTSDYVMRALRWLKDCQESDGSWIGESGGKQPGRHSTGNAPAMTSLALLAFLAHGETPNSEEFGETVEYAIRWLVTNQDAEGRFRGRDGHDYSQPIATYALCEAWGMTRIPTVGEAATRAVDVLVRGQQPGGGWDYNGNPGSSRSDLSYAGWCVQALKAARIADIKHPQLERTMERAVDGLTKHAAPNGGFGYTGSGLSPLTGVGVLGLQMLGQAEHEATRLGLKWLERATCNWEEPWSRNPIYHWYYVTQAKHREGGQIWNSWKPRFTATLCRHQVVLRGAGADGKDVGYWPPVTESEHCQSLVYNTALCTLTLEVFYRHGAHGLGTYTPADNAVPELFSSPEEIGVLLEEWRPTT